VRRFATEYYGRSDCAGAGHVRRAGGETVHSGLDVRSARPARFGQRRTGDGSLAVGGFGDHGRPFGFSRTITTDGNRAFTLNPSSFRSPHAARYYLGPGARTRGKRSIECRVTSAASGLVMAAGYSLTPSGEDAPVQQQAGETGTSWGPTASSCRRTTNASGGYAPSASRPGPYKLASCRTTRRSASGSYSSALAGAFDVTYRCRPRTSRSRQASRDAHVKGADARSSSTGRHRVRRAGQLHRSASLGRAEPPFSSCRWGLLSREPAVRLRLDDHLTNVAAQRRRPSPCRWAENHCT